MWSSTAATGKVFYNICRWSNRLSIIGKKKHTIPEQGARTIIESLKSTLPGVVPSLPLAPLHGRVKKRKEVPHVCPSNETRAWPERQKGEPDGRFRAVPASASGGIGRPSSSRGDARTGRGTAR